MVWINIYGEGGSGGNGSNGGNGGNGEFDLEQKNK